MTTMAATTTSEELVLYSYISMCIHIYMYLRYLPGPAALCALHHHFLLLTVLRSAGRLKSFTSHGARDEHTATNKGLRVNNLGT